jgi:hypothetical protein
MTHFFENFHQKTEESFKKLYNARTKRGETQDEN